MLIKQTFGYAQVERDIPTVPLSPPQVLPWKQRKKSS
jgi:hypothetical protein